MLHLDCRYLLFGFFRIKHRFVIKTTASRVHDFLILLIVLSMQMTQIKYFINLLYVMLKFERSQVFFKVKKLALFKNMEHRSIELNFIYRYFLLLEEPICMSRLPPFYKWFKYLDFTIFGLFNKRWAFRIL